MTGQSNDLTERIASPPDFVMKAQKPADEIPEHLSEEERLSKLSLLDEHEERIREFGAAFVAAALAIDHVASKKLFRLRGYRNIADYLAGEWGISRAHGHRFRKAAGIIKEIQSINKALPAKAELPIPRTQTAYRELLSVLPKGGTRQKTLRAILERAREKALDELKGKPKQAGAVIEIDVEHIRDALVVEAPAIESHRSRKEALAISRRRIESALTELMPVLDTNRTEDAEFLDAAKALLSRLLSIPEQPEKVKVRNRSKRKR